MVAISCVLHGVAFLSTFCIKSCRSSHILLNVQAAIPILFASEYDVPVAKPTTSAPESDGPECIALTEIPLQPQLLEKQELQQTKVVQVPKIEPKPKNEVRSKKAAELPTQKQHKAEQKRSKKTENVAGSVTENPKHIQKKSPIVKGPPSMTSKSNIQTVFGQQMTASQSNANQLQQALSSCWNPPRGVPNTLSCSIAVTIAAKGIINNITVEQSSGMLVYDIAATSAVRQIRMPRWTWGRSMTLVFKP